MDAKYRVKFIGNLPWGEEFDFHKQSDGWYIGNLSSDDIVWFESTNGIPIVIPADLIEDLEIITTVLTPEELERQEERKRKQAESDAKKAEQDKFIKRVVSNPNRIKRVTKYDNIPVSPPKESLQISDEVAALYD